ncbi:MAG: PAN/Apple domain-containing protein, partial [Amylibacter sp.]
MLKRYFLNAMLFLLFAGMAHADGYPESTFLYKSDTDFSGGDLRTIFETSQVYCEKACGEEQSCKAITYNTRNGACFLKDDSYQVAPYVGAISARLINSDPDQVTLGNARLQRLSYLTDYEKGRVISFRADVARAAGTLRLYSGKLNEEAVNGFIVLLQGAAVNGNSDAWLSIPHGLKANANQLPNALSRLRYNRLEFAVNAYLDAKGDQEASAVRAIIKAISSNISRGADIVAATRHLNELTGIDDVTVAKARAKFGPRVLDYDIETAAS